MSSPKRLLHNGNPEKQPIDTNRPLGSSPTIVNHPLIISCQYWLPSLTAATLTILDSNLNHYQSLTSILNRSLTSILNHRRSLCTLATATNPRGWDRNCPLELSDFKSRNHQHCTHIIIGTPNTALLLGMTVCDVYLGWLKPACLRVLGCFGCQGYKCCLSPAAFLDPICVAHSRCCFSQAHAKFHAVLHAVAALFYTNILGWSWLVVSTMG